MLAGSNTQCMNCNLDAISENMATFTTLGIVMSFSRKSKAIEKRQWLRSTARVTTRDGSSARSAHGME